MGERVCQQINDWLCCYIALLFIIIEESMYQKDKSLFLQIIEYTNLAIIIVFLLLFSYRLYLLRFYSLTDKFRNYFPKLRIFFCLAYVVLSASLVGYNIATDSYSEKAWYEYVLQGGGGECIDSIILIIQLGVLRLQLKKEQPYTRYHIWYFVYLMIMSLARFLLTVIDTLNDQNDFANSIISGLLVADSVSQFAYWIKNRQSLPEFINHTHEEIDSSRYHSQFLQKRVEVTKRSLHSVLNDSFPYISSFVSISNGKIRINLERTIYKIGSGDFQDESGLNESFLDRETALTQQFLASNQFTLDDIKRFYIICGRFPLNNELHFHLDIRSFIKELEVFLEGLFQQKKCYTPSVLKFLRISQGTIETYQHLLEKLYLVDYKGMFDMNTGLEILEDKSAPYFSVNLYRFMWVHDHYELYMRIMIKEGSILSYPIKRWEEIQEHFQMVRKMIKIEGKAIELPPLPKLHAFTARDDDLLRQNVKSIELFLRKFVNEESIIEDFHLRDKVLEFLGYEKQAMIVPKNNPQFYHNIKITKQRINKALIKNEYITLYEFKILKNGSEVKTIRKRFREIEQLHHDIQRWLKNRRGVLGFSLPEKVLYKPEIRHQKLKIYLENVIELKDIHKCYAASVFFDIGQGAECQPSPSKNKSEECRLRRDCSNGHLSMISEAENVEGQDLANSPKEYRSSKMFSKIIDDLGNQEYD